MATKEEVIHSLSTLRVEDRLDVQRLLNEELDGLDDESGLKTLKRQRNGLRSWNAGSRRLKAGSPRGAHGKKCSTS
jgi:hypothetical protein